jgi:hypothetical protein
VTAKTVTIGALYIKNQAAANAAVGAGGAGGSDARQNYDAVVGEINKSGGLLGRKIVPVYYGIDATSSTPIDQQYQQACAYFTKDHRVFTIFGGRDEIMLTCADKQGALDLYSGFGSSVPGTFRAHRAYVEISAINLVRSMTVTVEGLSTQNYFGAKPKIGVVSWDYPNFHEAVDKGLRPALAAHHLALAAPPQYVTPPQTVQELSGTSAGLSSAVLKFSTEGIDHVMLLDGPAGLCGVGCITALFMRAAQSQNYHPRYGLNDNNAPVTLYASGLLPAEQLKNSLAVGWSDLEKSQDAGWHVNAARERCFALMRKKGADLSSANAQLSAASACDELWFLTGAVNRNGGSLSVGRVMSWADGIGGAFASTQVYGTYFSAIQHDGVGSVRNFRFDDGCNCFKYTSTPYRTPAQ